jgi:hypothetical protein
MAGQIGRMGWIKKASRRRSVPAHAEIFQDLGDLRGIAGVGRVAQQGEPAAGATAVDQHAGAVGADAGVGVVEVVAAVAEEVAEGVAGQAFGVDVYRRAGGSPWTQGQVPGVRVQLANGRH